jgi:RNA recognition motif-containing protein
VQPAQEKRGEETALFGEFPCPFSSSVSRPKSPETLSVRRILTTDININYYMTEQDQVCASTPPFLAQISTTNRSPQDSSLVLDLFASMDFSSPFLNYIPDRHSPNGSMLSMSGGSEGGSFLQTRGSLGGMSSKSAVGPQRKGSAFATTSPIMPSIHPNLFVRGIPLHWTEEQLVELFSQYGELSSLRLVKHSVRKSSLGYGFVRYQLEQHALAAINDLHGKTFEGQVLQVKLADSDAGPPSTSSVSGLSPCDTLYIKHVPLNFSKRYLEQLFGQYGTVIDVKEFPCLDQFRGSSALVKMDSISSALLAIKNIHGMKPKGWLHNIIVRFAESDKEKKERLARKEQQQRLKRELSNGADPANLGNDVGGQIGPNIGTLGPGSPPGGLDYLSSGMGSTHVPSQKARQTAAWQHLMGSMDASQRLTSSPSSNHHNIIVHNIPPAADRLWIFENFSRFGAILSLSLDLHARTARIYFSEPMAGLKAVGEMNRQGGLSVELA